MVMPGPRRVVLALLLAAVGLGAPCATAAAGSAPTIWTVAGTGGACAAAPQCGDGGPATGASVGFPEAVALGPGGELLIADLADNEVRKLSPDGTITVVAGDGTPCLSAPACGDGGPATSAQLNAPTGVAVDAHGNVFIADAGDEEIREVSPTGTITRLAGTGGECADPASCGDGGPARSALLASPDGVAVDRHGDVFIADSRDDEIRQVDPHGTITTVAGDGSSCASAPACGDGGAATSAQLTFPESVAVDAHGTLFIADNGDNEIRRVSAGHIARVAGAGTACASAPKCGDGGSALSASLNAPEGVAVDAAGEVFIADWGDNEIRMVSRHGTMTRAAGNGTACASAPSCSDTATATAAQLSSPNGIAVSASGDLYIADTYDNEVRLVPATHAAPARAGAGRASFALLAFGATVTRSRVAVHAVLSGTARVSLSVSAAKSTPLLVVHASARAGVIELDWNRHLRSRPAGHGRYALTVAARYGRVLVTSTVVVTL